MNRLLYISLLSVALGITGCGHRYIERGPDREITGFGWSTDPPPAGSCYLMTLLPALQSLEGGYSPAEAVCCVFPTRRSETQPLLHLENRSTGDHLYTEWQAEIAEVTKGGYAIKDTCCYVYTTPGPGRIPLYRLSKPGTWCRFYTTAEVERDNLISIHGFTTDGVACYAPQDSLGGARILYRMRRMSDRE